MYTHARGLWGNMSHNGPDVWPINGNKLHLSSPALEWGHGGSGLGDIW
jgi:hypothetical protein